MARARRFQRRLKRLFSSHCLADRGDDRQRQERQPILYDPVGTNHSDRAIGRSMGGEMAEKGSDRDYGPDQRAALPRHGLHLQPGGHLRVSLLVYHLRPVLFTGDQNRPSPHSGEGRLTCCERLVVPGKANGEIIGPGDGRAIDRFLWCKAGFHHQRDLVHTVGNQRVLYRYPCRRNGNGIKPHY